MALVYIMC